MREGFGTNITSGREKYEGYWKDDLKHGKGKLTKPDNTVQEGYWHKDEFVGTTEQKIVDDKLDMLMTNRNFNKLKKTRKSVIDPADMQE